MLSLLFAVADADAELEELALPRVHDFSFSAEHGNGADFLQELQAEVDGVLEVLIDVEVDAAEQVDEDHSCSPLHLRKLYYLAETHPDCFSGRGVDAF